jgi:hypothetical protein
MYLALRGPEASSPHHHVTAAAGEPRNHPVEPRLFNVRHIDKLEFEVTKLWDNSLHSKRSLKQTILLITLFLF